MQQFIILFSLVIFITYAAVILYYRKSWMEIPLVDKFDNQCDQINFTVIIPARNEENNIQNCLESILQQSYTGLPYEVIVVDDFSTDRTRDIVNTYHTRVKLISLKDYIDQPTNAYKKKAIDIAVRQSTGDVIVVTDADCIVPATWLTRIANAFSGDRDNQDSVKFLVAPVAYTVNNHFLEIFQALDFMTLQGITGASVFRKIHSMCNGANLAYTKQAFLEVNGFEGIDHIASGDDMLLMHKIFKRYPRGIRFLKSQDAIVSTKPMTGLRAFVQQRIRWASKADQYDDKRIFSVLVMVYSLNVLFVILPVICLIKNQGFYLFHFEYQLWLFWVLLLGLKTIIELYFLYPVAKFFKQQSLLWWFPLAQPFHIVYTVSVGWLGKFGTYQWKDRTVR